MLYEVIIAGTNVTKLIYRVWDRVKYIRPNMEGQGVMYSKMPLSQQTRDVQPI